LFDKAGVFSGWRGWISQLPDKEQAGTDRMGEGIDGREVAHED
jgi:hypothetical protein